MNWKNLAAKGPLRRFAPWTAPGRSGRPLFTREKGGLLPGVPQGEDSKGVLRSRVGNSQENPKKSVPFEVL